MNPSRRDGAALQLFQSGGRALPAFAAGRAAVAAAVLQELLDAVGAVAHGLDRFLQLVLADAEFLGPVAQLVVLMHVNALAVGAAAVLQVVGHGCLSLVECPGNGNAHAQIAADCRTTPESTPMPWNYQVLST